MRTSSYSSRSDLADGTGCILALVFIGINIIFHAVLRGLVLSTLWRWFVISAFPHAPHLSIAQAIGLSLVVGMFTSGSSGSKNSEKNTEMELSTMLLVLPFLLAAGPLFTLFVGWIVLHFI